MFIAAFAAQASALEKFDRSAVLPELARAAKSAQTALTDYRKANQAAELAAKRLASGFTDIPKKQREVAKAKALCQLESSLKAMSKKLETFHGTMSRIQSTIEDGVAGGLGAMREKIDGLVSEFSAEMVQQERSSAALLRLADVSPDAVGEMDAQKLNNALDAMEQRKGLLKKLQERRERIAAINENIQQKIEGIKAVVGAVEVRISELKAEAYMVDVLKKEHQITLVTSEVFGLGNGGDPAKIFDSKSSQALDEMLGRKANKGMSQREVLRIRREGK